MSLGPIVLLCAVSFANAFSLGAFPVVLPDIGRTDGLGDFSLGIAASAFGFARLVADIPAGLFTARHLRRAILIGPCILAAGSLFTAAGGPLPVLVIGRAMMGAGHSLGTLASLTAILRYRDERSLSLSLNAFDMSGMVGVIGGTAFAGTLPNTWPWHLVFLVACTPQLLSFLVLPVLLPSIPADRRSPAKTPIARGDPQRERMKVPASSGLSLSAFAIGVAVALAWSGVGQFILPLRAAREFGFGRGDVASLLVLPVLVDVFCALPVGIVADRTTRTGTLGVVLIALAAGVLCVTFGSVTMVIAGSALLGLGLAGWNLPLSILRRATPPERLAWRTAQFRLAIDAGIFLGPFVGGILGEGNLWILSSFCGVSLLLLGGVILLRRSLRRPRFYIEEL